MCDVKTLLTPEDKDKVWRNAEMFTWIHYFWWGGGWMIAPCDPRTNPALTNIDVASGQHDGCLVRTNGLVEVPAPGEPVGREHCDQNPCTCSYLGEQPCPFFQRLAEQHG